mgnify:CR=1 FL=1|tara:strand:+ start:4239 stop:4949 length:711 start_codon:yes stop_codon:yes gene_type:complete
MESARAESESEFIEVADPHTINIQQILDKLDVKLKDLAFRDKVVDIGQTIRTINELKQDTRNLDDKEKEIKKYVNILKRLLFPFNNDDPNDTPLPPCEKQSWFKRLSNSKDDYVVYFCEILKSFYKNVVDTGNIKSSINPLGRERGEVPLLNKDYTTPFVLAAERASSKLSPEEVKKTLANAEHAVALEKGGGKRKTKKHKQKCRVKRTIVKNKGNRRKTKKERKQKKRLGKTKKN